MTTKDRRIEELTVNGKRPKREEVLKAMEEKRKRLILDNISTLAYIHANAKMHNNKEGVKRWSARLDEACAIATMLELATKKEITNSIQTAVNEAADEYERSLTKQ